MRDLAPLLSSTGRAFRHLHACAALTIWYSGHGCRKRGVPLGRRLDYADGAAEDELSIARADKGFSDIEFHP